MEKTTVFEIRGMTCDNCVKHVTQAVQAVPGVRHVHVELATNSARVEGDFDAGKVVAAVEEEGYEAAPRA
jgi:copper chaperone